MKDYRIKIRDWDDHFEADRSRQWKSLKWVPIPNKQGLGYKKIMLQKNGAEIFGCWVAIVEQGSLCNPRGDLSKYSIDDLSTKTMIPREVLNQSLNFIIQSLDWIEVIENLDKNVNDNDKTSLKPAFGSSMLCSSIQSSSVLSEGGTEETPFNTFWSSYPKKVGKKDAERAWKKIKAPAETLELILKALKWQKSCDQWTKKGGQFIPNPSTYLNQGRWMDEPTDKSKNNKSSRPEITIIQTRLIKKLGSDYQFPENEDYVSWELLYDTHFQEE